MMTGHYASGDTNLPPTPRPQPTALSLLPRPQQNEAASLSQLLTTVVREDLRDCDLVFVADGSLQWQEPLHQLLKLPNPRQVVHVTDSEDFERVGILSSSCQGRVFLVDDPALLLTYANKRESSWDYSGRQVVVGLTKEQLKDLTLTKSGRKTQHIVGVVKSGLLGTLWQVYRNQLYTGEEVINVGTWQQNRFTRKRDLFPDKLANLHGAVLKVALFHYIPAVFIERTGNDSIVHHYGRDVDIIKVLSSILNFTIEILAVPSDELWGERLDNGSYNGMIGFLGRDEADMGSGNLYMSSHLGRLNHMTYTTSTFTDSSCFMSWVEPPLPRWQSLALPYQLETWLALLGELLLCSPFLYILAKTTSMRGEEELSNFQSVTYSSLYVFGMHFRQPQGQLPIRINTQIFLAFLWLYAIIITTGYSCNLTAFLTVTRDPPRIETIKELHESKLPVFGLGDYFKLSMLQSVNKHVRGLADKYVAVFDVSTIDRNILHGKGVGIQGYSYMKYVIKKDYTSASGRARMRILKECFASHAITVGLQRHSPLKRKFDKVIRWMVEGGLIDQWFLESVDLSIQIEKRKKKAQGIGDSKAEDMSTAGSEGVIPLGLDHMQGIFLILIICCIISILVFMAEFMLVERNRS
ncbi:glutamate receptor ionotropic, delta-2-like isoform X2 [Homarus americanus]|uniref:glutamate receptor ionotropic, delta-2-like isoform X2 n=1 Tax=Homarus americanus TaxID=6706 RepID=UPI001C477593|nr:glutamate receptor ionotropic, delta-2-like isoform X2 [Homarus americanus]